MAGSLQQFIPLLATQDIKKRIQLGSDILSCLRTPSGLLDCEEIGFFIDSIAPWLSNSNFKVAQNGIEIMTILAQEMKEEFKPYISTIFPASVDRLGDSKDQVRLQAKSLLLKLMSPVSSAQYVFDKLTLAFNHKNFRVREEVMVLLQQTLDLYGSTSLTISRLMPSLVKLLGDPNSQVRDTAMTTLVHVYKHVGERLRQDISKRQGIPAAKLQLLFTKFDEVKTAGALLPSAIDTSGKSTYLVYFSHIKISTISHEDFGVVLAEDRCIKYSVHSRNIKGQGTVAGKGLPVFERALPNKTANGC